MALITKIKTVYSEVVSALGFTPENAANKGVANGYAGLDAGGRVPAAQLPSYVDDVQEYANLAAFPNPGAAGIIYLALDTNIIYRWSGSTYIEIASGDVAWADITGKPTFGTMSSQNANNVSITGGSVNVTASVIGNLSLSTNQITSNQASDDVLITPTGTGAVEIHNRVRIDNTAAFGHSDNGGTYIGTNAEYVEDGILSAWAYLQNGVAARVDFENGSALSIATAPFGTAGNPITTWNETFNISSAGDVVTGKWTADVINSTYGGTGVNNGGNLLNITANATISGTNTGDQIITLGGDATGSGSTNITVTFANSGVTAGTYGNATQSPQLTVDAKGRVTNGSNVTITPAWSNITSKPTTVSGYGITDAVTLTGTQSLTNKTFTDSSFFIQDNADSTKKAQFQTGSLSTGTTRSYGLPNVNGTLITNGDTGTVTNTMLAGSIADTKLNTISTAGKVSNSATTATSANTASAIVARDANGNFAAGNITAALLGNANTSTTLQTARNINGVSFDGSADITVKANTTNILTISSPLTGTSFDGSSAVTVGLNASGVTAGTYGNLTQTGQFTVSANGLITTAANVTITPAWASVTGTPTTVSGYGITDAATLTGTQTLINKTVTDATFTIQDDVDNTKKAQFQASSIATATTRTYTLPDVDGTLITNQEYTANDVLTKIKTVDGAGSGLDADLLDGLSLAQIGAPVWPSIPFITDAGVTEVGRYIDFHASSAEGQDYTVRLDAGSSTSARVLSLPINGGALISSGGTNVVSNTMLAQITAAGKVSNSATTATNLNTSSAIVARDASGAFAAGAVTVTSLTATGDITAYSDERLKSEWQALPNDFIEKVAQVKCGIFERTDIDLRQAGTSAQDWMEVLPEVVTMADDGLLSLAYGNAALVTVIELCKRIVQLEERLKALEAK